MRVMLVNCVAYQAGVKLGDIPLVDVSDYIKRPDCFVWVAVRDPKPEELDLLQEEFGLHELAVEDARHGHQRPKVEEYGKSLFVVLPVMEVNGSHLQIGEVLIFAGDNYVLSVRQHSEHGFTDVRRLLHQKRQSKPDSVRKWAFDV